MILTDGYRRLLMIPGGELDRHVRTARVHCRVLGSVKGVIQGGRRDPELFVAGELHSRENRNRGRQQG